MADKISKFLNSLTEEKLLYIRDHLDRIRLNDIAGMDAKPLKGHKGVYRVRAGKYRIIFKVLTSGSVEILYVGKRDDQTYSNF